MSQTLERSSSAKARRGEMVWLGVKHSCLGSVLRVRVVAKEVTTRATSALAVAQSEAGA